MIADMLSTILMTESEADLLQKINFTFPAQIMRNLSQLLKGTIIIEEGKILSIDI
jgi:hypothetical protein